MSIPSWRDEHMTTRDGRSGASSVAHHPVRGAIRGSLQVVVLSLIVVFLVFLTRGPGARDENSPAWSTPTGHPQGVLALAFSPDGTRLATGGDDSSAVLWEVGVGVDKVLSSGRQSRIHCVAFSRDGTMLAAGYDDSTCVLWDVISGKERMTIKGQTGGVMCLDFSSDSANLAVGDEKSTARLWDVATGKIKATLCGHPGAVCAVRFAPDGQTLATGCSFGTVKLWDTTSGICRASLGRDNFRIRTRSLAFSPDGSTLATGGPGGLNLWDVATGREREGSPSAVQGIREVAFSADGKMLLAVKFTGHVYVMDLAVKSERTFRLGNSLAYGSVCSPDGRLIAQGDSGGTVTVWDLNRALVTQSAAIR